MALDEKRVFLLMILNIYLLKAAVSTSLTRMTRQYKFQKLDEINLGSNELCCSPGSELVF